MSEPMTHPTERALISALIQDPTDWLEVRASLTTDDFSDVQCRKVYEAIEEMDGRVDLVLLTDWLRTHYPDLVGFASEIADEGMVSLCMDYARAVKNESKNRSLLAVGGEMISGIGKKSADKTIAEVEGKLISLYDNEVRNFRDAETMAKDFIDRVAEAKNRKIDIGGLPTPWVPMNAHINGLQNSDLIIIGARTSQGKTAMMLQMADHVACALRKRAAFFSLEMSENALMTRLVSQKAGIPFVSIRNGQLDECQLAYVADTAGLIAESKLSILDVSMIDIFGIRAHLKRMCNRDEKPDAVFIDYLTKISVDSSSEDRMDLKVGQLVQQLKSCAK